MVGLFEPFLEGLQQPTGPIPQSSILGKGLGPVDQVDRKTPGSRGVSGETGLGGNVTGMALTAVTLKGFPTNVLSQ